MDWREWLLENFAGDLEYHPKRGYWYLGVGVLSIAPWFLVSSDSPFAILPSVFALGGLGLFGKAIYLFRKSSEGIGLTLQEEVALEETAKGKRMRDFPLEVAQMVQDFGTGVLLLVPVLVFSRDVDRVANLPKLAMMLIGACMFAVGWFARWLIRQTIPAE